jgi:hypothetical protein
MSTIPLYTGDRYYRAVVVRDGRGVPTNPDASPTAVVYKNGAPSGVPVTTQALSGSPGFIAAFDVPPAIPGDDWSMLVSAAVDGRPIDRWIHLANAIFPGGTVHRGFITRDRRGAGVPPAVVSATVWRNGAAQPVPVTITPEGSPNHGRHMLSFTVPASWTPQDDVQALIEAVVQGKTVRRYQWVGRVVQPADVTITINRLRIMADEQTLVIQNDEQRTVIASDEQAVTVADIEQAVTVAETEQGAVV